MIRLSKMLSHIPRFIQRLTSFQKPNRREGLITKNDSISTYRTITHASANAPKDGVIPFEQHTDSFKEQMKPQLIPTIIDRYSRHDPEKAFASIPSNNNDLSQGFRDITYLEFRRAVDKAAYWLEDNLGISPSRVRHGLSEQQDEANPMPSLPTFAFYGTRDLRYSIFAVAAMKAGYKMLSPSLLCAMNAHVHLIEDTDCHSILCIPSTLSLVEEIINNCNHSESQSKLSSPEKISKTIVPELQYFLPLEDTNGKEDEFYPYERSWDEACNDPCLIIHTSGSTGMPKTVYYTQHMLAGPHRQLQLPPIRDQSPALHEWHGRRIFTTIPPFHLLGYAGFLVSPIYIGSVAVMTPPDIPIDADVADQMHRYARLDGGVYFPSLLQDLVRDDHKRQGLGKLQIISFSGSPLETSTGQWLSSNFGNLRNLLGSTESFGWPTARVIDPVKDWNYVHFYPINGIEFKPLGMIATKGPRDTEREHETTELYELVVHRTPETEFLTNIFHSRPHLNEWTTRDIWRPHPDPTKEGHWLYQGRIDDLVVLSGEVKLYASHLEDKISSAHSLIRTALVGGNQRKWPFLLLELVDPTSAVNSDSGVILDEIWPNLDEISTKYIHESVRLKRSLILVTDASRPLVRLAKGSVNRNQTFELYRQDIDHLYAEMEKLAV